MTPLDQRLQALDDFQVVRFCQHFTGELLDGLESSFEEIKANVPAEIRALPGFSAVEGLTPEQAAAPMPRGRAIALARAALAQFAADPGFAPALADSLDDFRDDALVADVIMAVGLAASLILIIATTEVRIEWSRKGFKLRIVKRPASPEMVENVLKPFDGRSDSLEGRGLVE